MCWLDYIFIQVHPLMSDIISIRALILTCNRLMALLNIDRCRILLSVWIGFMLNIICCRINCRSSVGWIPSKCGLLFSKCGHFRCILSVHGMVNQACLFYNVACIMKACMTYIKHGNLKHGMDFFKHGDFNKLLVNICLHVMVNIFLQMWNMHVVSHEMK